MVEEKEETEEELVKKSTVNQIAVEYDFTKKMLLGIMAVLVVVLVLFLWQADQHSEEKECLKKYCRVNTSNYGFQDYNYVQWYAQMTEYAKNCPDICFKNGLK